MAYDSYKLYGATTTATTPKEQMIEDKKQQISYLFNCAIDRESGCKLNDAVFTEDPRVFNRNIKSSYYQTLTCETININDRFHSGDMLFYDSDYWICTSSYVFHGLYCTGNFIRTNYDMKWQDEKGNIITQRCYIISSSQYNAGVDGNKTITLADNQYFVVFPTNNNTLYLDIGKRMFISRNLVKPVPYKLTKCDTVPFSDWDDGCVSCVFTREELNMEKDRPDLMLCDYISPTVTPTPSPNESAVSTITGSNILKIGYEKTYTVAFKDTAGNVLTGVNFTWNVVSDFDSAITKTISGQSITLNVTDSKYVGKTITLQVVIDSKVSATFAITVKGLM